MKRLLFCFCEICASIAMGALPVVSDVRASQRENTKLVDIYYTATDADGDLLKVRVEISDNDGVKYSVPAFSLTGDIGDGVTPGLNKHIVWNAESDWDGEYSDKMRVKVYVSDAKGFPGMEWSNEVKPGGFLLGQDGGAEGSGASRHVNVKWSYWIGKYEVTTRQYCEFLNAAFASGIVARNGTESVCATERMPATYGCPIDAILCNIGDDWCIRWNVNNFEVVAEREDIPAVVTWYGAMAFCRFYGYDLPTEAEWEKAARGPDHDDQDEHLIYPWGNMCSSLQAYIDSAPSYSKLSSLEPVASHETQINKYGLCGVVGNAAEWTRSCAEEAIEDYPAAETLMIDRQLPYVRRERVVKGVGSMGLYYRKALDEGEIYCATNDYWHGCYFFIGFRPVRRGSDAEDVSLTCEVSENFDTIEKAQRTFSRAGKTWKTEYSDWTDPFYDQSDDYKFFNPTVGVGGSGGVAASTTGYRATLYLPKTNGSLCFVRLKAKNSFSYACSVRCDSSFGVAEYVDLPAYMSSFRPIQIPVVKDADEYALAIDEKLVFDEIELWTIPKN